MSLSPEMQALIDGAKKKHARNNTKVLKVKEGNMMVRVLVPNPTKPFWAERAVHWIKADKDGKPMAVIGCDEKVHQKPCATCAAINRAMRSMTDAESQDLVKSWNARDSFLLQVYVPAGEDKSDKAQVLEVSKSLYTDILDVIGQWGTDKTLILNRTGRTVKDTRYKAMASPKDVDLPAGIMDSCIDLAEWVETEDFREEPSKAINAIASISGISVPPASPALTGGVDPSALLAASPAVALVPGAMPSAPSTAPSVAALATPVSEAPVATKEAEIDELEALLGAL